MAARNKVQELAGRLREAANLHDPHAAAIVELIRLSIEDIKESLVTAEGDDIHRFQGAARHLTKLHRELTISPPNIGQRSNP